MAKKSKEKWKTYKNVFDNFTERTIFQLMSRRIIDGLLSPVKIGKEANVFTALIGDKKVIVKIYRLESCNFNRMYDYIKKDVRFLHLKKKRRDIIFAWVQREHRNLMKAREAGVRVPTPMAYLNNVLVLEFIGDDDIAPQLKDSIPDNKKMFFDKLLKNMKNLYAAGLVHGDLSEFNILNYRQSPVLIDFSQATPVKSPNSEELLKRDIRNVCRFFNKIGVKAEPDKIIENIISKHNIFK